ncbi:MAG TPA: nucleotidyltransferase family protein [Ignavibacteriaceae bacterium]|nr:nucleotidyltransferase family protein [Ignavibacteriaceae bacterium]
MKTLDEIRFLINQDKSKLQKKYPIKRIGIFGSYAYGKPTVNSDVDIIIELEEPIGLDFIELADELEKLIGIKVDLVSANAIKPNMMKYVSENLVYI